jgi:hypothetical protein
MKEPIMPSLSDCIAEFKKLPSLKIISSIINLLEKFELEGVQPAQQYRIKNKLKSRLQQASELKGISHRLILETAQEVTRIARDEHAAGSPFLLLSNADLQQINNFLVERIKPQGENNFENFKYAFNALTPEWQAFLLSIVEDEVIKIVGIGPYSQMEKLNFRALSTLFEALSPDQQCKLVVFVSQVNKMDHLLLSAEDPLLIQILIDEEGVDLNYIAPDPRKLSWVEICKAVIGGFVQAAMESFQRTDPLTAMYQEMERDISPSLSIDMIVLAMDREALRIEQQVTRFTRPFLKGMRFFTSSPVPPVNPDIPAVNNARSIVPSRLVGV